LTCLYFRKIWGRRIACRCPYPAGCSPITHSPEWEIIIAKGQQRSNREPKKPKQNKQKKVESTLSKVVETLQHTSGPGARQKLGKK